MKTKHYSFLTALCVTLWAPAVRRAQPGAPDPTFNGTGYVIHPVNTWDATQKILV